MKLLTVDTLDEAREKIWNLVKNKNRKTETLALDEGQTRVLAEDIFAGEDIPGFDRSTVDGYAVVAADTAAAGDAIPVFLKQAGSVAMGKSASFSLRSGECAYVPTGGMIPPGADAVVMVEYAEVLSEGYPERYRERYRTGSCGSVAVYEPVASGAGVALKGEDAGKGDLLLRRGALIRPQEIGALAAAGFTSFKAFIPPALSIISTGDELVPPGNRPRPGEIRDVNTLALKALALKHGYNVVSVSVLPDDEGRLDAAVREALTVSDVVIIAGGSSQGEKDSTAKVINRVAKPGVFTHGLALKPGKPTILGWDDESQTLFAGLPGHPVAAIMVFHLLLGWLLDKLFCRVCPFTIPAKISCNIPGASGRTLCQPVTLHLENGVYFAEPVFGKSGMITTLTKASGFIIVDMNKEGLKKDEPVMVHLL